LTEPVAYAAFAWALYLGWRAIVAPSRRADALALAAIGVTLLSRTGFIVLLPVLPAAALLYSGRAVWRDHAVLVVATGVCLALVLRERWDLNRDDFSFFSYPAEAFHHRVVEGRLSVRPFSALPGSPDLKLAVALVAAASVAYAARRRPVLAGAVLAAVVGWQFAQTQYTLHMFGAKVGAGPSLHDRAFIDRQLRGGEVAGVWAVGPGNTGDYTYAFRGAEFWNTRVRPLVFPDHVDGAPYPVSGGYGIKFDVDGENGRLRPD